MDFTSYLGSWSDAVLTTDPSQRVRLSMCVNAAAYYVIYCVLLTLQIVIGFAHPDITWPLVFAELTTASGFYVFIRTGYNKRFTGDPSLLRVQLGMGSIFTLWAFAAVGPGSSAILMVVASQVVYAMFALPPRQVKLMIALTLVGLAAMMAVCHQLNPVRYPAGVQGMAFLYACVVYPLIGSLASRVTLMSEKLRANGRNLKDALEQLKEVATRDELTRVHNRRHMTELMQTEQLKQQRSAAPTCVALLDIDLFKNVNDRYGHQAGDEVLRRFAHVVKASLRTTDLLGRWGGEEFMVMFVGVDSANALHALQRLRDRLALQSFDDLAPGLNVSFSGGIAQLNPQDLLDAAIERADRAMYQAKTEGRSRSVIASPVVAQVQPLEAGKIPESYESARMSGTISS